MSEKDLSALEEALGVTFQDKDTLRQALVHRSYINEHPSFHLGHNERLEFLGDAVLELVVTEHLYNNYQNPEGELTNWRAALVNAEMCADVCESLGVNDYLYLSKGESKDTSTKAHDISWQMRWSQLLGRCILITGGMRLKISLSELF